MNNDALVYVVAKDKVLYAYEYPRPAVAVDLVVIAECPNSESFILLIRRGKEPFKNRLALPGGFLNPDETGKDGALREFKEETSSKLPYGCSPHFYDVADKPDRDPRGRTIGLIYLAMFKGHPFPVKGSDDAKSASWHTLRDVKRMQTIGFAFDHYEIIDNVLGDHSYLTETCGLCNRLNCHNCPCR